MIHAVGKRRLKSVKGYSGGVRSEDLRLEQMLRYEKELYKAGCQAIAGIDEVVVGSLGWASCRFVITSRM